VEGDEHGGDKADGSDRWQRQHALLPLVESQTTGPLARATGSRLDTIGRTQVPKQRQLAPFARGSPASRAARSSWELHLEKTQLPHRLRTTLVEPPVHTVVRAPQPEHRAVGGGRGVERVVYRLGEREEMRSACVTPEKVADVLAYGAQRRAGLLVVCLCKQCVKEKP